MFIYIMLIKNISQTKLNIILMLNEEDDSLKEYKSIQNQLEMYKEYKTLVNNSIELIKQIYEYNKKNEQKLFNNHNTFSSFDNIISNKLSMDTQKMTDRRTKLREKKSFLFKYFNIIGIKHFWLKKKITVMNYNYFSLMKNFVSKDKFYYTCLYIYSLNLSAVDHPQSIVSICRNYLYAFNKNEFQDLYEKIFNEYKQNLMNIKEESETEKNKMQNISRIFFELTLNYISLFPLDTIQVLLKLIIIYGNLKIKKYSNIEKSIGFILFRIKSLIYLPVFSEKKYLKIYKKYSGRNEIILNEMNKLKNVNEKIKENNNNYYNIIRQILEIVVKNFSGESEVINNLFKEKGEKNINNFNIINDRESVMLLIRLKDYICEILEKNDELYQKIIKFILDNIYSKFIPISYKYFWLKILHIFLKDEYNNYKEHNWIKFKSEDDFNSKWNKLKYETRGKKKNIILPVPVESIRLTKFTSNSELNNNTKYNIDISQFFEIIKEINEWSEEQALITSVNIKTPGQEFLSKILGINKDNKGLDFKKIKIIYYMISLKYIDFDKNDFIKNYNLSENDNKQKKNITAILELLAAKYYYMLNNKLFNDETKKEFWKIMSYYTNGTNKKEDEKIISFFNFIFSNCSYNDIILIFKDSNYTEYSIDFVSKLYNLYLQSFSKLKSEESIFDKNKTNELINIIISSDQNLILYSNELKNIIKLYYEINGYLKYDYNSFEDIYTNDTNKYINELILKDFSKRSRFNLYELYSHFFYCLNDDLKLFDTIMPKIALCIKEFKNNDKVDFGENILQTIEGKFKNYNKEIDFKILCDKVSDIMKKEENSNDSSKLLYLQTINIVYNSQKHFNFKKYTTQETFDYLYKVFISIKNEELKIKFASVFVSYFNDLSDEENNKFIKEYQEKFLKSDDNDNYIYLLMSQLLRFRMSLPDYIQSFIVSIKSFYKKKKSAKSIIDSFLKIAMDSYHGTYIYMKTNLSQECKDTLEEMTLEKTYFV